VLGVLREDQAEFDSSKSKPKPNADDAAKSNESKSILCKICTTEISSSDWVISMGPKGTTQAFANPAGHLREILTLSQAWQLHLDENVTSDFTWYAGYAWRIAYCGNCAQHLGWRFEAIGDQSLQLFYGLLTKAIVQK